MGTLGQLSTGHFAGLIQRYGETPSAYYRRVGPCPRSHHQVVTGFGPDPTCPLCGGVGELFELADLDQIIATSAASGKVVLQSALTSKQKQPIEKVTGEMQCSYLPDDYEMAEGDRLIIGSRDSWFQENRIHLPGGTGSGTDYLRYWPLLQIGAVYDADGLVSPSVYGIDATTRGLTFGGTITAGDPYVVRYRYRPQWQVVPSSHLHRVQASNGDRFPNRCLLRQWQGLPTDVKVGQEL